MSYWFIDLLITIIHKEDIPVCSQKRSSRVFTKRIDWAVRELDPKSGDACLRRVSFQTPWKSFLASTLEGRLCEHPWKGNNIFANLKMKIYVYTQKQIFKFWILILLFMYLFSHYSFIKKIYLCVRKKDPPVCSQRRSPGLFESWIRKAAMLVCEEFRSEHPERASLRAPWKVVFANIPGKSNIFLFIF